MLLYQTQISTIHAFCAQLLREHGHLLDLEADLRLCDESEAGVLAVGLARDRGGSEGESAQNARAIGALLEEATGLPVEFVDERGTTITAHGYLNETNTRGKKRKAVVDAVAATVILEDCLRRRRNQRQG